MVGMPAQFRASCAGVSSVVIRMWRPAPPHMLLAIMKAIPVPTLRRQFLD
jgi:hypothetical protein